MEAEAVHIASEAVANALRHAEASSVRLEVTADGDLLRLVVRDDGRGFGADTTAGVGLQSLHERAEEVGGTLQVRSAPGEGTTVVAELPWRVA